MHWRQLATNDVCVSTSSDRQQLARQIRLEVIRSVCIGAHSRRSSENTNKTHTLLYWYWIKLTWAITFWKHISIWNTVDQQETVALPDSVRQCACAAWHCAAACVHVAFDKSVRMDLYVSFLVVERDRVAHLPALPGVTRRFVKHCDLDLRGMQTKWAV